MELCEVIGQARTIYPPSIHKWNEYLGIELELENVGDPEGTLQISGWTTHHDASLRNGIEFVTSPAMGGEQLDAAISAFFRKKMVYDGGPRCSTHIHINMRDVNDSVLSSMVMIVYMIEDGIYQAVEESRKWGGYSVSLSDMPTTRLRSLLAPISEVSLHNAISPSRNVDRYYGMNTNMRRHGTVEFRYFPGAPTEEELRAWVDLVVTIKKAAKKYTTEQLIDTITSPSALVSFITNEFGDWGNRLLDAIGPDRMFNAFAEVATMAGDDDPRELASSVMWVSPHLKDFLGKTIFKDQTASMEFLENITKKNNVFAKSDWNYYFQQARQLMTNSKQNIYSQMHYADGPEPPDDYDDDDDDIRIPPETYEQIVQRLRREREQVEAQSRYAVSPVTGNTGQTFVFNTTTGAVPPPAEDFVEPFVQWFDEANNPEADAQPVRIPRPRTRTR